MHRMANENDDVILASRAYLSTAPNFAPTPSSTRQFEGTRVGLICLVFNDSLAQHASAIEHFADVLAFQVVGVS